MNEVVVWLVLAVMVLAVGLGLGWRAVERFEALQSNAEDLGFTDQILWNFLHGQFFRFTTYEYAEFPTDIDLEAVRRPDSLLAFHVEPILLLIAPIYLLIPDVRAILWLQALALALGAIPAYRLAGRRLGSPLAGLVFAAVYLLSPLGQWAALADFHSVALAAPLLLLAIDALDDGRPRLFLLAGLLAAATKEEVGLLVAGLGVIGLVWGYLPALWGCGTGPVSARVAQASIVLGAGWSVICVAVIIPHYSGGAISPFTARYAEIGGSPGAALRMLVQQPSAYLGPLSRPEVLCYGLTLLLSGVWLGLLAPGPLLVGMPVLALNVLSNSPWMAAGRAHYSASLLPLVIAAAIVGAGRLAKRALPPSSEETPPPSRCAARTSAAPTSLPIAMERGSTRSVCYTDPPVPKPPKRQNSPLDRNAVGIMGSHGGILDEVGGPVGFGDVRARPREHRPADDVVADVRAAQRPTEGWRGLFLSLAVLLGAVAAYHQDGIGPLVADLPAPVVTPRDELGRQLAASIPPAATVSASTGLYPHLSQRAGAYLFPTVRDADFVLVDVTTPYPVEPGGVRARLEELLSGGAYRLLTAEDGFVLLSHRLVDRLAKEQPLPDGFLRFARASTTHDVRPIVSFSDGAIEMVSARLVPGSEVGPRGPLGTLQTVWRIRRPVPDRPRPQISVQFRDGTRQTFANLPVLWWYPPEQWGIDELVRIDVPGLPTREVTGWEAAAPLDPPG